MIGDGNNLVDFAEVSSVAYAHLLAAEKLWREASAHDSPDAAGASGEGSEDTVSGQAFFITNDSPVAFRAFCLAIWREFGHIPPFEIHIPQRLAWGLSFVAECVAAVLKADLSLSRGAVADAAAARYACIDKAKRVLGYSPLVSLEDGIKDACAVCYGFTLSRARSADRCSITAKSFKKTSEVHAGQAGDCFKRCDSCETSSFYLLSFFLFSVRFSGVPYTPNSGMYPECFDVTA